MSTVDSTTQVTSTPTQPSRNTSGTLGKNDFLKLLAAQLQHQDPMNPMQDSEFMGQMASFSTLEQMTNMVADNETTSAIGLIGRTVTYTDTDRVSHTGVVEKVSTASGKPLLTVDGVDAVDPATITQVA